MRCLYRRPPSQATLFQQRLASFHCVSASLICIFVSSRVAFVISPPRLRLPLFNFLLSAIWSRFHRQIEAFECLCSSVLTCPESALLIAVMNILVFFIVREQGSVIASAPSITVSCLMSAQGHLSPPTSVIKLRLRSRHAITSILDCN